MALFCRCQNRTHALSRQVGCALPGHHDHHALLHPLATAIGPHGPGPLRPDICAEYKRETGHDVLDDFPEWEPCHNALLRNGIMGYENVGGDLEQVVGMRVTLAGFPIRWTKGDGSIVRIVAIVDEGDQ